jgi:tetratricopeptide (TPR) repeat protein
MSYLAFKPNLLLCGFTALMVWFLPTAARSNNVFAQSVSSSGTDKRERGIALFRQGEHLQAIADLKKAVKDDENDYEAWHFLGLAQIQIDDLKNATKSLQNALTLKPDFAPAHVGYGYVALLQSKWREAIREARLAVNLDPNIPDAHYVIGAASIRTGDHEEAVKHAEAAIQLAPRYAAAYLLKSEALVGFSSNPSISDQAKATELRSARYREAAAALEEYLQLEPNTPQKETWLGQIASLRFYSVSHGEGAGIERIYSSKDVTTKARVISKPEPDFPEGGRAAGGGRVVLRCIFAADGTVKHFLIVEGQPHGITEAALDSARRIKFVAAKLNDQPVSIYMQLEYDFKTY